MADIELGQLRSLPTIPLGASEELRRELAERGRNDLYFLCRGILGYDKLTPKAHAAYCRFVQGPITYNGKKIIRRMMLVPRDHLKTTIGSIGHTAQLIINDPSERILIPASTADIAEKIMAEISNHFRHNELFRWLYQEIIPEDFSKVVWNKTEITVKRDVFFKEPTVSTIGARGAAQSRHFTRIKCDDIIGEKEYQSEAEMDKTIRWAKGLEALLVTEFLDTIDVTGTRWRQGDVYEELEEFYSGGKDAPEIEIGPHAKLKGELAVFHRHARDDDGEPYFPEMVSKAYLDRIMLVDPEQYASWYANDPITPGLNTFEEGWLAYHVQGSDGILRRLDPLKETEIEAHWHEMERFILFDPAVGENKKTSARQALLVIGVLHRPKQPLIYILETRIGHYAPNVAVDYLFELQKKWATEWASVEKFGYQGSIKYWLRERAERDHLPYISVREFPPKGTPNSQVSKDERIKGLQPLFRARQISMLETESELIEEFLYFPKGKFRDALDALAQGLLYWPTSENTDFADEMDEWDQKVVASIDETGYGIRPGSPLDTTPREEWDPKLPEDSDQIRWRGHVFYVS